MMDRRGLRVVLALAVAAVPAGVLLAPRANLASHDAAARNEAPPGSALRPGSFDDIQSPHVPGSSTWDELLAVPTASPTTVGAGVKDPASAAGPRASKKPGHSAVPTSIPTLAPTLGPTANPTVRPTVSPTIAPTPRPTSAPTPPPTPQPTSNPAACTLFPSDNVWNRRVDDLPVRSDSGTLMGSIGLSAPLHPDFSSTAWNGGLGYGIPFNKVNLTTPTYGVQFQYADESDPGPYPIPASPKIEGGSDAHLLLWDTEGCNLYEIFDTSKSGGQWYGGSGAVWDLRSNALRPNGWTSADAAGLPILPGLARYDEVAAGAIRHALRFTAPRTCSSHLYPARHDAGSYSCSTYPPMGLRIRLKASVDISGFGPQAQVILLALKRYGMLLADNGSAMYLTGAPNASWDDDQLHDFGQLHGSDFEAVDTSSLRNG
jgi:hypothetical protein